MKLFGAKQNQVLQVMTISKDNLLSLIDANFQVKIL